MQKKLALLLTVGALTAGICAATATPANATTANLPSQEVWVHYYSSSSMDTGIGFEFVTSCFGVVGSQVGQTSDHYVISSEPCFGSSTGEVECYIDGVLSTCPADICDSELFDC